MVFFLVSCIVLFGTSTAYHTFLCVSKTTHDRLRKADFACIALLMFAMFLPFCTSIFCPVVAFAYIAAALCVASTCVVISNSTAFDKPEFHVYRPVVFGFIRLLGTIGMVHGLYKVRDATIGTLCACQITLCLIGACFYAFKWPERNSNKPRIVTNYANSHFIFHVCVSTGLLCFYEACRVLNLNV